MLYSTIAGPRRCHARHDYARFRLQRQPAGIQQFTSAYSSSSEGRSLMFRMVACKCSPSSRACEALL